MIRHTVLAVIVAGGVLAPAFAAGPQPIQPGLWEETRKITALAGPDAPPAAVAALRRRPPVTTHRCITAAEVADGMRHVMDNDFHCPADIRFSPGGGFDARAVCRDRDGEATMHFHGQYSPVSFSMTGEGVATGAMNMRIRSEMSGHWVGPCH